MTYEINEDNLNRLHRWGFNYKKLISLIDDNKAKSGDSDGDNGLNIDIAIISYYLLQKYENEQLKIIGSKLECLCDGGTEALVNQVKDVLKII